MACPTIDTLHDLNAHRTKAATPQPLRAPRLSNPAMPGPQPPLTPFVLTGIDTHDSPIRLA